MTAVRDGSIHCVATSPPYWGLRSYLAKDDPAKASEIGAEPTPEGYVASMVDVGREVRRVLREDGSWWLNLGDSYSQAGGHAQGRHRSSGLTNPGYQADAHTFGTIKADYGIPAKNIVGIPWMVAFALRADGWILRAAIPWVKGNCMPESVQDRPTTAHETVFLLARSERYYFDADAVRVPADVEGFLRRNAGNAGRARPDRLDGKGTSESGATGKSASCGINPAGRNIRTSDFHAAGLDALEADISAYLAHVRHVRANGGLLLTPEGEPSAFLVNPVPSPYKHFAMWPPALVKPMILASTSERGCCPACGAPWRRVVERKGEQHQKSWAGANRANGCMVGGGHKGRTGTWTSTSETLGFAPSCPCPPAPPIPCTVLDPFAGTATTLRVAEDLGRHAVGYELNSAYLPIAAERTAQQGLFAAISNGKDSFQ